MAKHVPSAVPGHGPSDAGAAVGGHFAPPAASGADQAADMRDGDSDEGSAAPVPPQTTVPASAAAMTGRGGGTP